MRLRGKALATTVAVMAVGYVIVTLAFTAQILRSARVESPPAVKARAKRVFELAMLGGSATMMPDGPKRLEGLLQEAGLAGGWAVVDSRGVVFAAAEPARRGRKYSGGSGEPLARAADPGGAEYRLYAYAALADPGLAGHLAALLPAMLLATALLGAALWLLLSRQVLTPVVELAEASRLMASGSPTARARGEGRADEVGELVRAFNRMAEEVAANRRNLERRVVEETEKARRAEAAANIAQRLAATGKLAAGVAHEINNPLGGMINAAKRLEASIPPADGRGREYLGLIQEGLERVARITRQMLRFQRPAAAAAPEPVNVAEALASALGFAEHRLKGVELAREFSPGLPAVLGARGELEQVFLNLILNAADAVKDSAAKRVAVRARAEDAGQKVVVEVEDSGCGMTPEECQAAFDIFHTTKPDGSGLGLSVAHSIVAGHGGELLLESAKGRGTKAVVRLPAAAGGKVQP
jgi:signal transduction histidine kinase